MKWLLSNPAAVDHDKVVEAIHKASEHTSGEIRVLIARHKAAHPIAAAIVPNNGKIRIRRYT